MILLDRACHNLSYRLLFLENSLDWREGEGGGDHLKVKCSVDEGSAVTEGRETGEGGGSVAFPPETIHRDFY
jgi:hypothetical protein